MDEQREKIKEKIFSEIKLNTVPRNPKGGQSVGITTPRISLHSECMGIEIIVGHHKSQIKNKDFAMLLMELAIDELLK